MKVLVATLFACGILTWGFGVSADTILTDNFESYNNGVLNGQGTWSTNSGIFTVQDGISFEGTKALQVKGGSVGFIAKKTGTLRNDGVQTVYVRRNATLAKGYVQLYEGEALKSVIGLQNALPGKFTYFANGGHYAFGDFGIDTWYAIQIQWRGSDHKMRYNVNGGAWTDYYDTFAPWVNGLDVIGIQDLSIGFNSALYIDAIQEGLVLNKTPVLIVPGLLGTDIKDGNELLWTDLERMFVDIDDSFLDKLSFNSNLQPGVSSLSLSDVIRFKNLFGAKVFNYTENLIAEFQSQGYIENATLFTFPYDWRYGATGKYSDGKTNSDLLSEKIQSILTQTGADKVDVIAHSMGGLITKKYVVDNSVSHHIGKAVFVGVPNTGAPKSVKVLLQGDNFGVLGLSDAQMQKISVNMPAAYDLLPSQQYYDMKGSYVKVVDQGFTGLFTTVKDLTYDETNSFLTGDHQLNATASVNAESLHTQAFDNFDMRTAGVNVYAIDGCTAATIGNIIETRSRTVLGQEAINYRLGWVPGDKTVPLESATNLPIDASHKFYSLNASHGTMMTQEGSRQQIVNIISGSNLAVDGDIITQDIGQCELNGTAVSIFSPVDIFVTDALGNKLGLAADGSVINEIPNAAFEVFGDHKFLYVPTDNGQMYTISMDGTGTGTYTITNQDIVNGEVVGAEVFSNLPVTADLTGTINLGPQTTLTVKENTGAAPQTILPSSTVTGDDVEDVLPPEVTAIVTGTQGQAGFYRSDVTITVTATDSDSGVLSVTPSATFATEGQHTFTFFATDKAGNNSQVQTITFTIDKTAPEAVIAFDPVAKDLTFTAQNDANAVVTDKDNVITLTDQAGNVTEITLRNKNRRIIMAAQISSIKYNGVAAAINNNAMIYGWLVDKNKKLVALSQYVRSKNNYNILAVYNGKNTTLLGKDALGIISKSFIGLKIIKITTNKGDFEWSY